MSEHSPHSTVDTRLSRLETIIDSISSTLDKIQTKLDSQSKINWAPVTLGVTIFMAVVASFSTIYNTRITTLDSNIKILDQRQQTTEVATTEQRISIQTLKDRQEDMKTYNKEKFDNIERKLEKLD